MENRITDLSEELQIKIHVVQRWSLLILLLLTFFLSIFNLMKPIGISKETSIAVLILTGLLSFILYVGYHSALAGRGAVGRSGDIDIKKQIDCCYKKGNLVG
jgi:hypothetical protein